MNRKGKPKQSHRSESRIDELVTSQAEDRSAWTRAVQVRRRKSGSFSIPEDLARRAAFLARLRHAAGVEEWLNRVIRERVEIEELAYGTAKRELLLKGSA